MARDTERIVVVKGGGAMSVFWGLVLFFIVMPVVAVLGCFACVGTAVHQASRNLPTYDDRTAKYKTSKDTFRERQVTTAEGDKEDATANVSTREPQWRLTLNHYNELINGMTYDEVRSIIGRNGEEMSRNKIDGVPGVMKSIETVMYVWKNSDGSNMNAMFQNDRLMQKAQFGLRSGPATPRPATVTQSEPPKRATIELPPQVPKINAAPVFVEPTKSEPKATKPTHEMRTWTSTDGRTLEAQFMWHSNGVVALKKQDGTVVKVPIERFSEADQRYARRGAPDEKPKK